ncbi:hypothetical protein V6Z12_D11G266900 [Gossypium hirsutum]
MNIELPCTAVLLAPTATPCNRRPEGCHIWVLKPFLAAFEGQGVRGDYGAGEGVGSETCADWRS